MPIAPLRAFIPFIQCTGIIICCLGSQSCFLDQKAFLNGSKSMLWNCCVHFDCPWKSSRVITSPISSYKCGWNHLMSGNDSISQPVCMSYVSLCKTRENIDNQLLYKRMEAVRTFIGWAIVLFLEFWYYKSLFISVLPCDWHISLTFRHQCLLSEIFNK